MAEPPPPADSGKPEGRFNVERLLAIISQAAAPADPLVEKMTREHVGKVIDNAEAESRRDHQRQMWAMALTTGVVGAVLLLVLALCWMFLSWNKADQAEKIVAALIGFAGGVGVGRWTRTSKD